MGTRCSSMLFILALFILIPSVVSQKCDVRCPKNGYAGLLKRNQCACSPNFKGTYPHKSHCTVRLVVDNHSRVRLEATDFLIRQYKQGQREYLLFENMENKKMNKLNPKNKGGYFMRKVWNRSQMLKNRYIIVNSHEVRMKFRADAKGSLSRKKWRVCLKDNISPNLEKMSCPAFSMTKVEKGFNRRHADVSSNDTHVTETCCTSYNLDMKRDEAIMMCEDAGYPTAEITKDRTETCLVCSSSKQRVAVQADIPNPSPSKRIDCTCSTRSGASIGEDCTGGVPCLDLNHKAYCDEDGDNTCKCPSGMVPDNTNSKCGPRALIGEDCTGDNVCASTYKRSFCDGSVCACPNAEYADTTSEYCTNVVAIGASCLPGYTCDDSLSRATCKSNTCSCPTSTSADSTNSYCTYKSNYKGFCTNVLDCVQSRSKKCNTATNKCACESPYGDLNGYCSYRSIYGAICVDSRDCLLSNSKCSSSKCVCKTWYRKKSNTVCSSYCSHKTGGLFDAGKFLCNKQNSKCYKCKCTTNSGSWSIVKTSQKEYRSNKNACYTKMGSSCNGIQKLIRASSKCGNT